MPRLLSEKKAFEMVLLGESISAAEAERIGLVNKVVTEEELDKTADEFARKFLEKSSLSVKLCREAFYQAADKSKFEEALQIATELGIKTWETGDGQEGLIAFMEKRKPNWKGK
jgi:enoyl-CoA hydratase/carnithine racemase